MEQILAPIRFDRRGLVPVIVRDNKGKVLMLAYMNRESFLKTVETGIVHFWSRSRKKLWKKGETSGHIQRLEDIRIDCDGDALMITVKQSGGCCHNGYYTCFWRKWERGRWKVVEEKVFEPENVYK
jgi:phosphoribosyl-AMP cyclohydrolase